VRSSGASGGPSPGPPDQTSRDAPVHEGGQEGGWPLPSGLRSCLGGVLALVAILGDAQSRDAGDRGACVDEEGHVEGALNRFAHRITNAMAKDLPSQIATIQAVVTGSPREAISGSRSCSVAGAFRDIP